MEHCVYTSRQLQSLARKIKHPLPLEYLDFMKTRGNIKFEVVGKWRFSFLNPERMERANRSMNEFFEWGDDGRSHLDDNAPLDVFKLLPIAGFIATDFEYAAPNYILLSMDGGSLHTYTHDHSDMESTFQISSAAEGFETTEDVSTIDSLCRYVRNCQEEQAQLWGSLR